MSKKLPYFQFEPAEYLTGNIQFCSLEAQGLFVNIKSIYWQRDCSLTTEHLNRLFNYPKLINELIKENIIKINDEFIIIGFLDIQYEEITNRKERLSIAGKKGAEAKRSKATLKPPLSKAEATLKQLDKIKEDKIKEDKIKSIYNLYPTMCIISNRSLSKSKKKNCDKIKALLKDKSPVELETVINQYMNDCRKSNTYMKNFDTFLNNLPDIHEYQLPIQPKANFASPVL